MAVVNMFAADCGRGKHVNLHAALKGPDSGPGFPWSRLEVEIVHHGDKPGLAEPWLHARAELTVQQAMDLHAALGKLLRGEIR